MSSRLLLIASIILLFLVGCSPREEAHLLGENHRNWVVLTSYSTGTNGGGTQWNVDSVGWSVSRSETDKETEDVYSITLDLSHQGLVVDSLSTSFEITLFSRSNGRRTILKTISLPENEIVDLSQDGINLFAAFVPPEEVEKTREQLHKIFFESVAAQYSGSSAATLSTPKQLEKNE